MLKANSNRKKPHTRTIIGRYSNLAQTDEDRRMVVTVKWRSGGYALVVLMLSVGACTLTSRLACHGLWLS